MSERQVKDRRDTSGMQPLLLTAAEGIAFVLPTLIPNPQERALIAAHYGRYVSAVKAYPRYIAEPSGRRLTARNARHRRAGRRRLAPEKA